MRGQKVAPLVGARIEIAVQVLDPSHGHVAPLVGARIEIAYISQTKHRFTVAPLVGARIEIVTAIYATATTKRRSPRGSED